MEESTHEYRPMYFNSRYQGIYENSFLDDSLNNESILNLIMVF